jgi:hypothetical protein
MKCEKCGEELTVDNNQNAWCIRGCFRVMIPNFNNTEDILHLVKDQPCQESFVMDLWYSPVDAKYTFMAMSAVHDPSKS